MKRYNSDAEVKAHVSLVHGLFYALVFGMKGEVVYITLRLILTYEYYQVYNRNNVSTWLEDKRHTRLDALAANLPNNRHTRYGLTLGRSTTGQDLLM